MILHATDTRSNLNDQLVYLARMIGMSQRKQKIFDAVYTGKKTTKTVDELVKATKLDAKTVLTVAGFLADNHVFAKTRVHGRTAYTKEQWIHTHKQRILDLARNKKKRAAVPTKTNPKPSTADAASTIVKRVITKTKPWFRAKQITIDDVDTFARAWKVKGAGQLPKSISETKFKRGVQKIIGEGGQFNDWGGEKNDLFTTRVRVDGRRVGAAFQFKGPGKQGLLVPGKLGKNGDQIQRLFATDARVFFVQYWQSIAESVVEQMHAFAIVKSISTRDTIYFGIIDGTDSLRLYRAYERSFRSKHGK